MIKIIPSVFVRNIKRTSNPKNWKFTGTYKVAHGKPIPFTMSINKTTGGVRFHPALFKEHKLFEFIIEEESIKQTGHLA